MAPPRPQANGDVHENGHLELPPRHENGDFVRHENGNGAVPSFHGNGDAAHENGDITSPPRYENGDEADENGDSARHENGDSARHENGNGAMVLFHGIDNPAYENFDENEGDASPPGYEYTDVVLESGILVSRLSYVLQVFENSDAELPAEDEDRHIALQPGENELSRVMDYALQEWQPRHMEQECETDAVLEEDFFQYPLGSRCPPTPVPDGFFPTWPLHFQSVTKINGRRYLMQLEKRPFDYSMHKFLVRSLPFPDWADITHDLFEEEENPIGIMRSTYRKKRIISVDHEYLVRLEITRVYTVSDPSSFVQRN